MKKRSVTQYIADYLLENQIPEQKVARDTGIAVEKLRCGSTEVLDADEFLRLCVYLGIRPEDIKR